MSVAEAGIFNRQGLSPIESVERTNLYEFMNYLAYKSTLSKIS